MLLVGAVLTGCGGGEPAAAPVALPPVSGTVPPAVPDSTGPSVSSLPSNSATDEPTAAQSPASPVADPADAAALARLWIDALNEAQATLDGEAIAKISAPSCQTCARIVESLKQVSAAGERYDGGAIEVLSAVAPEAVAGTSDVLMDYRAPEVRVLSRDGRVIRTIPATERGTFVLNIRRAGDTYLVDEVRAT